MAKDMTTYYREFKRRQRAAAKAEGRILSGDDWNVKHPERRKENGQRWYAENKDRHLSKGQKWRQENREAKLEISRRAYGKRVGTSWGAIDNCISAVMSASFRSGRPSSKMNKYNRPLGYTWAQLAAHVEAQFHSGMTWANRGILWELDHIIPRSSFRYTSIDDPKFKECWALANMRPLLRHLNRSKGAKAT